MLESDDSELEDFLDDILERGRSLLRKGTANRVPVSAASSISTAVDARLEYGVEGTAEVMLRRLTALGAYNLPLSVNAAIQPPPEAARQAASSMWDEHTLVIGQPADCNQPDSLQMLTICFDKVFTELHQQVWIIFSSTVPCDCVCTSWNETFLQTFDVFYASRKCLYFINKLFCFLCVLSIFCIFLLVFYKFFEPNSILHSCFLLLRSCYWSHLMMNCKTQLYAAVLNMSKLQKKIYLSLNIVGTQCKSFFYLFHMFV